MLSYKHVRISQSTTKLLATTTRKPTRSLVRFVPIRTRITKSRAAPDVHKAKYNIMNISDFAPFTSRLDELGTIVPGINTTCDVGVGETPKQAKKFGNKVSQGGIPPTLRTDGKLSESRRSISHHIATGK
jgi:hypothetical protein